MERPPSTRISILLCLFSALWICPSVSFIPGGDLNLIGTAFGIPGNASFDYVVVGGGTAGATLAARLAENGTYAVALVEAGSFYEIGNGNSSVVPSGATAGTGASPADYNPLVDWGIVTVPQTGLGGRRVHYARGKCLGGSSARNYFLYHLPTKDSLAKWASEVGDNTYQYGSFLKYYHKSVNFTQPNNQKRASNASYTYNGTTLTSSSGPLHVTLPNYASAFASWLLRGLAQIGILPANDFVSGSLNGATYGMMTLDPSDMTRSSAETSFWRRAVQQTNLVTYQATLAKRIIFESKRASGVVVNTQGLSYTLLARKEVIISSGVFQSPQLLMVSGVGPEPILSQHNINVVHNLPGIGQNMWDHIFFGPSYRVNLLTHSILGNAVFAGKADSEYLQNQTGVVGNPGGDTIAWEKLPKGTNLSASTKEALATFPLDWPSLEYLMLDGYAGDNNNYILGSPKTPYQYASVVSALVAPLSRGNVTIKSADTSDLPLVDPNWFTNPADQELGIAAFRRLREVMDTSVIKSITIGSEVYPGRNVSTDAEILAFIRNAAITVYHASSTCKMGKKNDTMAVLDSRARVYGVESLRVVDTSSFPFLPPGHPQSTVYALAEKIADDILNEAS